MISIGYDIGSSSIKCAFLDCESGETIAQGFCPSVEMEIQSPKPGWAEQDPNLWWQYVVQLTRQLMQEQNINPDRVKAVGISYQMHGLVLVDIKQQVLRPAIIWCDSRAVEIGRSALDALGKGYCLKRLLNSPGNFTASKLRWVNENEPEVFKRIHKSMLPGEYIAMKLAGEIATTISGLSEGIYWDFQSNTVAKELLEYFKIDSGLLPDVRPTFSVRGRMTKAAAQQLGLREGTPVAYCAGDQPNNAFSLNALNPGEAAATAGTSGVVYGVTDKILCDPKSRVNVFAHVNHACDKPRLGVLLCINGTGILNSWLRRNVAGNMTYQDMNTMAAEVAIGSEGVSVLPFGNGSERILENRNVGCQISGLDFNRHSGAHLFRASQEGIAFSFKYGLDIMKEMGIDIQTIRASHGNMFLSPIFRQTLANIADATIELYATDGAIGAARGAAIGVGLFTSFQEAF
ncbi:MAG TPA: FGGY family carbohydrate kinase, partial [Bacteroidota bacterium]